MTGLYFARPQLLAPIRPLDLVSELGFLCGKVLGGLGADVIKVELVSPLLELG